jgi:uncharacterized protein (DUF488 family)
MSGRVFSIGHGGRSVDGLVTQLRAYDIPFLIDVRSVPYSRFQRAFCREPLGLALERQQLKYVYMGDALGGRPQDPACYDANGNVDYQLCRTRDEFRRGIERVQTAHHKGMRVCLLCAEARPTSCHRTKLLGRVLHDHGITVEHVLPDGTLRTQAQVIDELTAGQGDLFG